MPRTKTQESPPTAKLPRRPPPNQAAEAQSTISECLHRIDESFKINGAGIQHWVDVVVQSDTGAISKFSGDMQMFINAHNSCIQIGALNPNVQPKQVIDSFFQSIRDIGVKLQLRVRIVRLWIQKNYENKSLGNTIEMVLLNEKGGRIRATVKNRHKYMFEKQLTESHCYEIYDVSMGLNEELKYKTTPHKYRFYFHSQTIVNDIVGSSIPKYDFNFISFQDIKAIQNETELLIDIIGNVSSIRSIGHSTKYTRPTKYLHLDLEDMSGERLTCTLWNGYADQMLKFRAEHPKGPYILILQFAKTKRYCGYMQVSNSFYASKMLINANIPEVSNFMAHFQKGCIPTSHSVPHFTPKGSYSVEDDLVNKTLNKKIDLLKETAVRPLNDIEQTTAATIESKASTAKISKRKKISSLSGARLIEIKKTCPELLALKSFPRLHLSKQAKCKIRLKKVKKEKGV